MKEAFLELFLQKVNEFYTCYYEEVPPDAKFPYLVLPKVTITPLDDGYLCLTDLYIYNNELSDVNVEKICDDLRDNLDKYSCFDEDKKIGFHTGFENDNTEYVNEQDLIFRKINFSSRIFKM